LASINASGAYIEISVIRCSFLHFWFHNRIAATKVVLMLTIPDLNEAQRRRSNGFEILLREYEGIWPGNRNVTLYLVASVQLTESNFVSLTITTTPKEFKKNRKIYEDIVNSLQVSG
jgi:hypothetical protein